MSLHGIALKEIGNSIAAKMMSSFRTNEFYEFESLESFEKFYENFTSCGTNAMHFLQTDHVLLRPDIDEKIRECRDSL